MVVVRWTTEVLTLTPTQSRTLYQRHGIQREDLLFQGEICAHVTFQVRSQKLATFCQFESERKALAFHEYIEYCDLKIFLANYQT